MKTSRGLWETVFEVVSVIIVIGGLFWLAFSPTKPNQSPIKSAGTFAAQEAPKPQEEQKSSNVGMMNVAGSLAEAWISVVKVDSTGECFLIARDRQGIAVTQAKCPP